jgi:hypothetical protein
MFLIYQFKHFKKEASAPRYRYRSKVNIKEDNGNFVGSEAV